MKHMESVCKCKCIFADHRQDAGCVNCDCKLFVHIEVDILVIVSAQLRQLYELIYNRYLETNDMKRVAENLLGPCIENLEILIRNMEND